ncbi:hypothetical protein OAV62_01010 [bacterium]|nr:hypothetical protein [bacterium]
MVRVSIVLCLLWRVGLSYAVDPGVLWLPKSYNAAMPQLIMAAQEAEATERCKLVIGGELIISRSDADEYHFTITCRDKYGRSYNRVYQYPVGGEKIELLLEQRSTLSNLDQREKLGDEGPTREQALKMCIDDAEEEAILIGWVNFVTDDIRELPAELPWTYQFSLPFFKTISVSQSLSYFADCRVDGKANVDVELRIDRSAIQELCIISMQKQTQLMMDAKILGTEAGEVTEKDDMFYVSIPFTATNPAGLLLNYQANCVVNDNGRSEVEVTARR